MSKQEEIKKLSEQLLKLLNTPDSSEIPSEDKIENEKVNDVINKLTALNVDATIVRQIMKRVDEVYGKSENYIHTKPLFEEYDRLTKSKKI